MKGQRYPTATHFIKETLMNTLIDKFKTWYRETNQFKKYKLGHRRNFNETGYYDNRTNWAYLAWVGGYKVAKEEQS